MMKRGIDASVRLLIGFGAIGLGAVGQACSGDFTGCFETRTCKPPVMDASAGEAGGPGDTGEESGLGGEGSVEARPGGAGAGGSAGMGTEPNDSCGDGVVDPEEVCDLGDANRADAYGKGECTDRCSAAPYCGDGKKNGPEVCDSGEAQSQELGSCNPECTGYYEKKYIRPTFNTYPGGGLGGIAGADAKCELEFGAGWKALLVGAGRRATVTPFVGDGSKDWVVARYTHYFNYDDQLIWRTDAVPLLGVRDGKRINTYAPAFKIGNYPWSGWASDWTTLPENEAKYEGTCAGWSAEDAPWGSFAFADLTQGASESCSTGSNILCVEQ